MDRITFKQFIKAFNFRNIVELDSEFLKEDTKIIRIYLSYADDYGDMNSWFEFGVSEYSNNMLKCDICKKIFNKEILDSYIENISVCPKGTIEIFLIKEKSIDK